MDPEEAYSMMEAYGMGGGPDPQEKLVDTDFFNSIEQLIFQRFNGAANFLFSSHVRI